MKYSKTKIKYGRCAGYKIPLFLGDCFYEFYIGNSIEEIDEQDINVEFSDELINFIYKLRGQASFDMSKLYEIDPYDDVVVSKNDLV